MARSAPPIVAPTISPVLRLQEDLSRLGYLPVSFDGTTFTYAAAGVPAALLSLFRPGVDTPLIEGALMTFEADNGLPIATSPNATVWDALRADIAAGRVAPHAFTYTFVEKSLPERVYVWSPSGVLTSTLANTGVAGATTPDGTFPVYERLTFQVMRGTNLNGDPYADPVHWISYFYGGDAVHGFIRAAYGFPQSLGCVEVPLSVAQTVWDEMQIGTPVTVSNAPFQILSAPGPLWSAPPPEAFRAPPGMV